MAYTEYQGVEVVTSDPTVKARHPRYGYGEMTLLKDASLLALVDGTFLVVCDECGFNGITGREPYVKPEGEQKPIVKQADSVLSHKSGTHWRKPGRPQLYTEDAIRVVIKIALKWKSTKIRNWARAACTELDQMGFKPALGESWTTGALGNLLRTYSKQAPYKNLKPGPMTQEDQHVIEEMVRAAIAREAGKAGTHVADNVRVTAKKPHTPIDFAAIIEAKNKDIEDDAAEQREGDGEVHVSNDPKLSFSKSVTTPVRSLTVPVAAAQTAEGRFKHLLDLPTGEPVFTWDGVLMVGKPIKGVEV